MEITPDTVTLDGSPSFEAAKALQDELAVALVEAKGIPFAEAAELAAPIVRYLQQQYGGDELYIPRPGRSHPIAEIVAARRRGEEIRVICNRFRISRRTFFNLMQVHGR